MNNTLKALLNRVPISFIAALYLGSLAWNYWEFENSSQSPLNVMKAQVEEAKIDIGKMNQKVKQAQEFRLTLDQKRADVQRLALELDGLKSSLSETLDMANFMKTILTEAKSVGLNVMGLKPYKESSKEFYVENIFEFKFKGVYIQLLVFMERLTQIQNIIRVDSFSIKPIASSLSKYVELDGTIQIKTFHYQRSKADDLVKKEGT